jgi:hypothetical protein
VDDGVACVVPALGTDDHIDMLGEVIDDLALAFIAPLGAHYDGICHDAVVWKLDA